MAISKKWSANDEQGERSAKAEMALLQGELQVYEAARAVGESAYHFRKTRRAPLFKILSELENTCRALRALGFVEVVPLYVLDENGLTRMESQPLNFDPSYVIGWTEFSYPIENGVSLHVGFGLDKDQTDSTLKYSIELLCRGNETSVEGRKLLADITRTAPKKYTHYQLTVAVGKRIDQFEGYVVKPKRRGRAAKPN